MSDTKISEEPIAWVDIANWRANLEANECFFTDFQDEDTVPVYLHPQPAELAEQQGDDLVEEGLVYFERSGDEGDRKYVAAIRNALAATGKQQQSTFDGGGEYYADQHGDGAWATYLRNGKGWVYNFGQGDDAEIRAKSVARELNRQVSAITARMQVGDVQGDARRILAKHMRRIAAAHNVPRLATEADIVEGGEEYDFWMDAAYAAVREALAARQPGAQPTALTERLRILSATAASFDKRERVVTLGNAQQAVAEAAAQPAQGIDLGQFRRPVEEWRADMERWVEVHGDYDGAFARDIAEGNRLLVLIGQRDAAPGVVISQGTHDPSGVANG